MTMTLPIEFPNEMQFLVHVRPIVCKFTRRIIREQVMNNRNDACKVIATSVGIPADCSFEDARLFDHLTPQNGHFPVDAKKFQNRNGYKFCWAKNCVVYLRQTEVSCRFRERCGTARPSFELSNLYYRV